MISRNIGSPLRRATGSCSPGWWGWAPLVVAEALRPLEDPLPGLLRPGPPAPPREVARALAASLGAPRAGDPPPSWLDPEQADAVRLLLAVLRQYGAALCAEPVGTGKTFIALAIATTTGGNGTVALVPAALATQWRATADRLGVAVAVWSHSRLSLGQLPPGDPGLVIVDESHHFRNPTIRRYRAVAPWLVGRRVLLLSATPIVNHSRDLYHQLHLGIRDDALSADGSPSMRVSINHGTIPPALGRFVIQRLEESTRPKTACRTVVGRSGAVALIPALESLQLSRVPGIAALIRSALFRAAASSAAALEGTLRRYRGLLLHARDASDSGRSLDRVSLRRFTLNADDQLLLWALLPTEQCGSELRIDDLPRLEEILARARDLAGRPDDKVTLLRSSLASDCLSLVFVSAQETVSYLRNTLADRHVAWCTGARSGIGRVTLPREAVLGWFHPRAGPSHASPRGRPTMLVATDVVAEGLDLQAAGQIVHYDLPWTDVGREQRNGRAVRRGSRHASIEVIQLAPGRDVEARLHQLERLAFKSGLPRLHGLGPEGRSVWRWREELAATLAGAATEGVAGIGSGTAGALAGIALQGREGRVVSTVFWREQGGWTVDPGIVAARIAEAARAEPATPPTATEERELIASLAQPVRALLQAAAARRIAGGAPSQAAGQIGKRLRRLASVAARRRDAPRLAALESALAFCTGGHTAGEERLIEALVDLDDEQLLARLPTLPRPTAPEGPLRPRLTGIIVFRA